MNQVSKQSVIQAYNRYASVYDALFGSVQRPGIRRMAGAVSKLASKKVLEVGIGTGLTLDLYPEDTAITGIDISDEMLELARKRANKLKSRNIQLELMDAEQLQFPDNSFDCVTVPYVLSVTPNPDRLISEIRRVCRPNGHIVIVNHFSGSKFWSLPERLVRSIADKIGFRSDFDFTTHVLKHDWQIISSEPVQFFGLYRLVTIKNEP